MMSIHVMALSILVLIPHYSQAIFDPTNFIAKEAMVKVWTSCIGPNLANEFALQVKDAVKLCKYNSKDDKKSAKLNNNNNQIEKNSRRGSSSNGRESFNNERDSIDSTRRGSSSSEGDRPSRGRESSSHNDRESNRQNRFNDRRLNDQELNPGNNDRISFFNDRNENSRGIIDSHTAVRDNNRAINSDEPENTRKGNNFWRDRQTTFNNHFVNVTDGSNTEYQIFHSESTNRNKDNNRTGNNDDRTNTRENSNNRDINRNRDQNGDRNQNEDKKTNRDQNDDRTTNRDQNNDRKTNRDQNDDRKTNRDQNDDRKINRDQNDDRKTNRDQNNDKKNNRDQNDDRKTNRDQNDDMKTNRDQNNDRKTNRDQNDDRKTNRDQNDDRKTNRDQNDDRNRNKVKDDEDDDLSGGNYFNQRRIPNLKQNPSKFLYNKPYSGSSLPSSLSTDFSDDDKPIYFTLIDQIPFLLQSKGASSIIRSKRETNNVSMKSRFSVQDLIDGENELQAHLSNFSCVLETLDLVDSTGNLRMDKILNNVRNLPLDPDLKKDLLDVIKTCDALTNCQPDDGDDVLIPRRLELAMSFFKCTEKKRQMACLKKDIRMHLKEEIPEDRHSSFDMERTVTRIMYIKMKDTFADFITALS